MSPAWIRVGSALMRREILERESPDAPAKLRAPQPAVTPSLHSLDGCEVAVNLTIEMIRMFPLEPHRLVFDAENSNALHRKRADGLHIAECQMWVVTLPKLSKGRCVGWRENLPESGYFKGSYERMRAYWQDSYGYILPAHPPRWYFDVRFSSIQEEPFTYPSYCVLSDKPEVCFYRNTDLDEIANSFVADMTTALPELCGKRVNVHDVTAEKSLSTAGINVLRNVLEENDSKLLSSEEEFANSQIEKQMAEFEKKVRMKAREQASQFAAAKLSISQARRKFEEVDGNSSGGSVERPPPIRPQFKPTENRPKLMVTSVRKTAEAHDNFVSKAGGVRGAVVGEITEEGRIRPIFGVKRKRDTMEENARNRSVNFKIPDLPPDRKTNRH